MQLALQAGKEEPRDDHRFQYRETNDEPPAPVSGALSTLRW